MEMSNCDLSGGMLQKKKCTVSLIPLFSLSEKLWNARIVKPRCSKELN